MMSDTSLARQLQGRRAGRAPGSHFTLWVAHGRVLPAPNCNISLLVLTLPLSQAGSSVITADQFTALFGIPSIAKTTADFA